VPNRRPAAAYGADVGGVDVPPNSSDERELLLSWLGFLRAAVLRKAEGLSETQARRRPHGALLPLLGIVNHLTHVEWRWIDGGFGGASTSRTESEFFPGPELALAEAVRSYTARAEATDAAVRALPLTAPCALRAGADLRWVLLHLLNETARHAGHADATRELLDGFTGE
jgi:uncharacterized damage-inducible protein DinB